MTALRSTFLTLAALVAGGSAPAQSAASAGRVSVSLVSEAKAVEAGKPFTVGLKLEHPKGFHTYWINPGIGSPTKVKWSLPEGWQAGELVWPVPQLKTDEVGGSHIYDGTVYLIAEITPAAGFAAGQTAALQATVSRLECDANGCRPATSDVKATVLADAALRVDAAIKAAFDAVRAQQPVASAAWKMEARDSAKSLTVVLSPQAGASKDPGDVVFFDRTGALEIKKPRVVRKAGGVLEVTMAKNGDKDPPVAPAGFLHASKGWFADGSVPSLAYAGGKAPKP